MNKNRACVFDLDDTLYPERAYAHCGFAAVATAFDYLFGDPEETTAELIRLFDENPGRPTFNSLLDQRGVEVSDTTLERLLNGYRTHAPTISLFPDADAALTRLRDDFRLGIITDGRAVSQRAKINALGLEQRVDEIIVTSELAGAAKPSPVAFEEMARRLGAAHEDCTYIADNRRKDFVAPNRLGWSTVCVDRDTGLYRDLPAPPGGEPHTVISSLAQFTPG